MKLPLLDAWGQPRATDLIVVQRELTPEDCEAYDHIGWHHFRETDLIDTFLPSLGNPLYFSEKHSLFCGVVVEIRGVRYLVQFEDDNIDEPWSSKGKSLILSPTDLSLSIPDDKRGGHYLQFFGQPVWVQGAIYPADARGNPCCHFLTIENGWGDSGNFNILLGMDGDLPSEAYFEASCC